MCPRIWDGLNSLYLALVKRDFQAASETNQNLMRPPKPPFAALKATNALHFTVAPRLKGQRHAEPLSSNYNNTSRAL